MAGPVAPQPPADGLSMTTQRSLKRRWQHSSKYALSSAKLAVGPPRRGTAFFEAGNSRRGPVRPRTARQWQGKVRPGLIRSGRWGYVASQH